MKRGVKRALVVLVILAVAGGLGGSAYYRYQDKIELGGGLKGFGRGSGDEVDTATPVAVHRASQELIGDSLMLHGEVVPLTSVNIFSKVPGRVKEILVDEGTAVTEDQQVLFIDRSEAGLTYTPAPVESTIDGLVKEVFVEIGDSITPQVPLLQVIDMDIVEVVVHISERDIGRIVSGLRAEIEVVSYPDRIFQGRVGELSPVVDPLSRTREARIRIDNRNHVLKPGMFGDVKITIRSTSNNVVIPLAAVVEKDEQQMVFVVNGDRAVQREPVFDIREGNRISVLSGVEKDDRVIVIGQQNVNDGDEVRVTEEIQ
jgi:membrane fusion protein (multidrug efflux system)